MLIAFQNVNSYTKTVWWDLLLEQLNVFCVDNLQRLNLFIIGRNVVVHLPNFEKLNDEAALPAIPFFHFYKTIARQLMHLSPAWAQRGFMTMLGFVCNETLWQLLMRSRWWMSRLKARFQRSLSSNDDKVDLITWRDQNESEDTTDCYLRDPQKHTDPLLTPDNPYSYLMHCLLMVSPQNVEL